MSATTNNKQQHAAQIVASKELEKKMNTLRQTIKKPVSNRNHPWRLPFKEDEKPMNNNNISQQVFNI